MSQQNDQGDETTQTPTGVAEVKDPAVQLKEIKEQYIKVVINLESIETPVTGLIALATFLQESLNEKRADSDPEFRKFLYEDIGSSMAKRLMKTCTSDEKYLKAIADFLEVLMRHFYYELSQKRYDLNYIQCMTLLFQHDSFLHRFNYHLTQDEIKNLAIASQSWRKDLIVGSKVDVLVKADERSKLYGWIQGTVTAVGERGEDILDIQADNSQSCYDIPVNRYQYELAEFESRTKEDYAWRKEHLKVMNTIDGHDKYKWMKATIIEVKEATTDDRTYPICSIGFRVYKEVETSATRKDELGNYDGWSKTQDEWIPWYSPRVAQFMTKSQVDSQELMIDESFDEFIKPEQGFEKVYAVPRIPLCTSSAYIHLINLFGNLGGFDLVMDLMSKAEMAETMENGGLDITCIGVLSQCLTLPHIVFHKDFIAQNGELIGKSIQNRLLQASDKSLREVRKEQIDGILKLVDSMMRRFKPKDERERTGELLKLELSLKQLSSTYLERRINGIRDLSTLINNNTLLKISETFTTEFLINWMVENEVFDIIWNYRKTHQELVTRSNDIFRLLAKEHALTPDLRSLVWELSKSEHKLEVLKLISVGSYYMSTEDAEFFAKAIAATPTEDLTNADFDLICEFGKWTKTNETKEFVFQFFFNYIQEENVQEDLTNIAIDKCSEMVKLDFLEGKQVTFEKLLQAVSTPKEGSTLPMVRLFLKMVRDEREKDQYKSFQSSSAATTAQWGNIQMTSGTVRYSYGTTQPTTTTADPKATESGQDVEENVQNWLNTATATETTVASAAPASTPPPVPTPLSAAALSGKKELTMADVIRKLEEEHNLVEQLIKNLHLYIEAVDKASKEDPSKFDLDRMKIFMHQKYSHHQEVELRLQLLTLCIVCSDFTISKEQLKVIYDLLSSSSVTSDKDYFLYWVRNTCKKQSDAQKIFDFTQLGEFFAEIIEAKQLDLATLPVVGFLMIQDYFLKLNASQYKLKVFTRPEKKPKIYVSQYNNSLTDKREVPRKQVDPDTLVPLVCVMCPPDELEQMDLLWGIVLNAEEERVFEKAADLLATLYSSLEEDASAEIPATFNLAIDKCIALLENAETSRVTRVTKLLKKIIQVSEKCGTNKVVPHNAILTGECLDRIIIRNEMQRQNTSNLVVKVYTSCSVWEFMQEVAYMFNLAPQFLKLKFTTCKRTIKDTEYGMTIEELGLRNGDILTAKVYEELIYEVERVPLLDEYSAFKPIVVDHINWLYDLYRDEEGFMTPQTTVFFIRGCTDELCFESDDRISGLFQQWNKERDFKLKRDEFLAFYHDASCRLQGDNVYGNFKMHNIRADLTRVRDMMMRHPLARHQMPRYTMSARDGVFQALLKQLDRNDESSAEVWDLIHQLATNQQMFKSVLQVEDMRNSETGKIDWNSLLENKSIYRKVYNFEIIQALLEENKTFADNKRIEFVEQIKRDYGMDAFKNEIPIRPVGHGDPCKGEDDDFEAATEVDFNDSKVKEAWKTAFIEEGGFQCVVQALLNYDLAEIVSSEGQAARDFVLKTLSFMLNMLKIFLIEAFQSNSDANFSLDGYYYEKEEESKDEELLAKKQKSKEEGIALIMSIDMPALQQKILQVIATIIQSRSEAIEEKQIIENALSVWAACILFKPELFKEFTTMKFSGAVKSAEDFIMTGVLFCPVDKIRNTYKVVISELIKRLPEEESFPLNWLLTLFGSKFELISDYPCRQFFDLFNEIIDTFYDQEDQSRQAFDPEHLLGAIIDKIRENKNEIREAATAAAKCEMDQEQAIAKEDEMAEKDRLMVGLVELMKKIFSKANREVTEKVVKDHDLMNFFFKEFLFESVFEEKEDVPDTQGANKIALLFRSRKFRQKGQTLGKGGRQAAYNLISSMIGKSASLMELFMKEQLNTLFEKIHKPKGWKYSPNNSYSTDKDQKYVGLKNLGCICYMISMMQQFFMIPAFRYNLLSVDDGLPAAPSEYQSWKCEDDNLLHQIQKLIAHLELSERSEYDPADFVFSFKEMDGTPTKISEQKDAQEFLNVLFDRLENNLRPTTRKYLCQSIFAGKTVSQLVCKECGYMKNKNEDFYNLSLNIGGVTTVQQSLQALIKGEEINDFTCDGCKKKVDISKRLLISETPNVLIVHLQRIVFSFETFQNVKVNTLMEFPTVLDLKPYSYYEVLRKEGKDTEQKEKQPTEEGESKEEEEEREPEPIEDDCFEYKLVGMNIHSGTANAGHYWSYINTERSSADVSDENQWANASNEPWMEYNDSRVSDWSYTKVKDDCFGDDADSQKNSYFGGTYGKSAYMLFYERKVKKPIKILVPEAELEKSRESESSAGREVYYDEKEKEHYKLIPYNECLDAEAKPNAIYSQVSKDNKKFTFETDVYSEQFFGFVKDVLVKVADFGKAPSAEAEDLKSVRMTALTLAKTSLFDILARCKDNDGMKDIVQVMIDILKQDAALSINFLAGLFENKAQIVIENVLESNEATTRVNIAHLVKFLLSHVLLLEKDKIYNKETEEVTVQLKNSEGEVIGEVKEIRSASVFVRSMDFLISILNTQVARCWARFDEYLEMIYAVAVYTPEVIIESGSGYTHLNVDIKSESFALGMHYFFQANMIEKIGDFILGDKSPFKKEDDFRPTMGSSYIPPNFTKIMMLFNTMLGHSELLAKFPLSLQAQSMFTKKSMLVILLEPTSDGKPNKMIDTICRDNEKMTRKMAKNILKKFSESVTHMPEKLTHYLRALKKFLLIDDQFKRQRMEWIFGVPQICTKKDYQNPGVYKMQMENIDKIDEPAYTFCSTLLGQYQNDGFLAKIMAVKGQVDTFCLKGLKDVIKLCVKDDTIARYVFEMPGQTLQTHRFIDWFEPYLIGQKFEVENSVAQYHKEQKLDAINKTYQVLAQFKAKMDRFQLEAESIKMEGRFTGLKDHWLSGRHEDVMPHFPPRYIVGKWLNKEGKVLLQAENDQMKVKLIEFDCEYMYSNPTKKGFNLSLAEKPLRSNNYTFTYEQWKQHEHNEKIKKEMEEQKGDQEGKDDQLMEPIEVKPMELNVKKWSDHAIIGQAVLALFVSSKAQDSTGIKVEANVEFDENAENQEKNMTVFTTGAQRTLYKGNEEPIRFYLKHDPSNPVWGPMKLTFSSESLGASGASYSSTMAGSGAMYSYGGTNTMASLGTVSYGPTEYGGVGSGGSGDKIPCLSCQQLVDFGQTWCNHCGKETSGND